MKPHLSVSKVDIYMHLFTSSRIISISNLLQQQMEFFFTILLYVLLFLFLHCTTKSVINKLTNLPPSPFFILPIIGHMHLLKKPLHLTYASMSKKYGPVFSLQFGSRRVLVVNSASAAEDIFSKNDAAFASRPRLAAGKYLGYNYKSISSAPYGDHWRNLRRIASIELLSAHRIQSLSHLRLEEVRELLHLAFRLPEDQVVDMSTVISEYLFNVMTRIILGKRYYGDKSTVVSKEAREFQGIKDDLDRMSNVSNPGDFIPLLKGFGKAEKIYKAVHNRRDRFFQDSIERVRSEGNVKLSSSDDKGKTLIEVLLSLQQADPDYYTDELIKGIITVLFQAGTDTSVRTMEWTMTLLLNNPFALQKLQDEIDSHVGNNRLLTDTDLSHLPYLKCVIKEAQRLFPVFPLHVPHESTEECTVGGFRVPGGTMLFVNVWAIHHDPTSWEDPFKFKPERFMGKDITKEELTRHMPFGKGRRGCPGEPLAFHMISLALGSLVQCFDWQSVSNETEDLAQNIGFFNHKRRPLMVKCSPRPGMTDLLTQFIAG